jgi:hypothetical protein
MTQASFHPLFAATAGVAGALIGLLFVAISIEHERLTAEGSEQVHRVRARAALSAFTNALVVSLFALIPDGGLGWTTFAVGVAGLLFVAAALISLWRAHRSQNFAWTDPVFLTGQVITFALQIYYGLRLATNDADVGATRGIAVLVAICFLIGIARSWELIGGPSIGLGGQMLAVLRTRRREPLDRDAGGPD